MRSLWEEGSCTCRKNGVVVKREFWQEVGEGSGFAAMWRGLLCRSCEKKFGFSGLAKVDRGRKNHGEDRGR